MESKIKTKILITGANGNLGKKLGNFLLNFNNIEIINLIKSEQNEILHDENHNQIIKSNISNIEYLRNVINEIDVVIHLAFPNNKSKFSKKEILKIIKINNSFFNLMVEKKVKKFIYLSTAKIKIYEELNNLNTSNYESCKLKIENEFLNIAKNNNINLVILRAGIVYGSNINNNFSKYIDLIKKNNFIPLISKKIYKNIIFIDYFLNGILYILKKNDSYSKPVYLYERNINLLEFTLKIQKILRVKNKIIILPNFIIIILKFTRLYQVIFKSLYDSFYIKEKSIYKIADDQLSEKVFYHNMSKSFEL